MRRAYFVFCLIPLVLVSVFFLCDKYGPGGQTGFARTIFLAEVITISCPLITVAGLFLICVEAYHSRGILGPFVATTVAALPGMIFWIIEHRGRS